MLAARTRKKTPRKTGAFSFHLQWRAAVQGPGTIFFWRALKPLKIGAISGL